MLGTTCWRPCCGMILKRGSVPRWLHDIPIFSMSMTAGIQGETSTLADMNIVISTVNRLTRNTPIYFQAFLAWLQVKSEAETGANLIRMELTSLCDFAFTGDKKSNLQVRLYVPSKSRNSTWFEVRPASRRSVPCMMLYAYRTEHVIKSAAHYIILQDRSRC